MKKYIITLIVIVLIIGIYSFNNKSKAPTNSQIIKIGAVLGLTGYAANDSLNVKRGLELAKEDLAKKGVIVDINYQDDKTDPKQTVSAIQYLLATYHPQAVIGPIWSFLEEAGGPVLASSKIISYAPADTSEFVSVKSPYLFRGAPLNALLVKPISKWLKDNNKTRVAIIVSNEGWGTSIQMPFIQAAKDAGATIVVNEAIQTGSSDTTSISIIMTKIKATKADVILITGYDESITAIAKNREAMGINATIIAAGAVYPSLVSRGNISQNQAKDAYFIVAKISDDFVTKFKAKYGEHPGSYADRAYDGLMILVEAIEKNKGEDSDAVSKHLHDKTNYKGYGGTYNFNDNGDIAGGEWIIEPVTK